jgi:hypothetical protein
VSEYFCPLSVYTAINGKCRKVTDKINKMFNDPQNLNSA